MAKTPAKGKPDTGAMMDRARNRFGSNPPTTANDTVQPSSRTRIKPSGGGVKVTHTIKFKGKK